MGGRNGNLRRLYSYIFRRATDASVEDGEETVSDCHWQVCYDGKFLEELGATTSSQRFAASGLGFRFWFAANYPGCVQQVRRSVAKQFERPLAALARRETASPFDRSAESLISWIDRLLRFTDENEKPECEEKPREKLKAAVPVLELEGPFDPGGENFKDWYLRAGTEMVWNCIEAYEKEHPFEEERTSLDEWFVGALSILPVPAILLRGYKSFDPRRGGFDQWFYGVIVRRAMADLRRKLGNRSKLSPDESPIDPEPIDEGEKAFGGLANELLESALKFVENIQPPMITARRAKAFTRYAQAIRMHRIAGMSYQDMAGQFVSEQNAKTLVSRGQASFFALLAVAVDVQSAVKHAQTVATPIATREEARRLERTAPFLLAVHAGDLCEDKRLSETWIASVAAQVGTTSQVVREQTREAWKVLLLILDTDGKSFYDFQRSVSPASGAAPID